MNLFRENGTVVLVSCIKVKCVCVNNYNHCDGVTQF